MKYQKITPAELKSLRTLKGVSQAALAHAVGLQRSYVSQFETGKYLMTDAELQAIADYFEALPDVNDHVSEMRPESLLEARVVDGLLVPGTKDSDALDTQLENWRVALDELTVACNVKMPRGFLGGVDANELDRLNCHAGLAALKAIHCMFSIQGRELFTHDEGTICDELLERVQGFQGLKSRE
jgi:transcriptional regulator with XRE-family HTH domain